MRLARHGWGYMGALSLLCGCTAGLDFEGWRDVFQEHGQGHSSGGAACRSGGRHEPLTPLGVEPREASVDVEPYASVSIAFSAPLDPESVSLAEIELVGAGSVPVPGNVAVKACGITFTPSERLVLDTTYTLRLDGSVRGRRGSEWTGAVETGFRTRDGVWSEAEKVATSGDTPQLAAGPDGSAVLAWQVPAERAASASVALAQYTPSEHWQALPISGTSGGPYSIPRAVAVDGEGDIELLWFNTGEVYAAVYRLGEGLGEATSRDYHAATTDGDGALAGGLAWAATNAFDGIVLKYTTDGSSWSEQTLFGRDVEGGPRPEGPRLTADSSGNARAFWTMEAALYLSSHGNGDDPSSWSPPQAILALDPGYGMTEVFGLGFPLADAESDLGHSLLAWQEDERSSADPPGGGASRLRIVQVAPDGSVDAAQPEPLGSLGNAFTPALAMSSGGDALLSWVASEGTADDADAPSSAWIASRSAGAAEWSTSLLLSGSEGARARSPAVAIDPSGNGHAVWLEIGASGDAQLRAARFSREGGELSASSVISGTAAPAPVSPEFGGNAPRVVVDAGGRAIAVWAGADGGIWSARFE